ILCRAEFLFLRRMPADGGWIKQNLRSAQRGQSCRLGIPLVPANADADFSMGGFPRLKSEIARREVKLLVVKRIIGNVHLAIFAKKSSVSIDDGRRVVIDSRTPFLEERRNDHD